MHALLRRYGAHPLHLLALTACFCLAGFAAWQLLADRPIAVLVWFVGAAVGHDLVLLPLYVIADGSLRRARVGRELPRVPWLNYVRFPAAISALLLLVFLPSIARLSDNYAAATHLSSSGYLFRWLAITGLLFFLAALAYAVRLRRSR